MTGIGPSKPDLGRFGIFTGHSVPPEQVAGAERLGYGAVWLGGSPNSDLAMVEPILEQTGTIHVATGVVNIWSAPAGEVAESYHRIESRYPGRFLLGVGVGHPEHTGAYRKPYGALVDYLDALDAAGVPASRRVIAALGPRVLKLAAERSAGAFPYLTTPAHTAVARDALGADGFLASEHKVVLTGPDGAADAREIGRRTVSFYLGLSNYANNWRRLGFTEEDLAQPGSDRLIDSLVGHGSAEQVAATLSAHLTAGADHVVIQVLGDADPIPTLTALAGPLGLTPPS